MWRWSSLIQVARAMKRRAGPLRMMWSMDAYLSHASAGEDKDGNQVKTKTATLRLFDQAVKDPFFWSYLATWSCPNKCCGVASDRARMRSLPSPKLFCWFKFVQLFRRAA